MNIFQNLNSPLQQLDTINGVELWLKRDDLIHPEVSGNKWRKLKYYLEDFKKSGKEVILTFGGAFSNHLAATAAIGEMAGITTKALVRGEEVTSNPTLDFCRRCGMEIEAISRKRYETKDEPEFRRMMEEALPDVYVIPEGGKGALGMRGCLELMDEVDQNFDVVACVGGTGTTMAGILKSSYKAGYLLFPALKGGIFLERAIYRQLSDFEKLFSTVGIGKNEAIDRLEIEENYHFGGYGKVQPELIAFMNHFFEKYGVALDPVYTGKMLFGLIERINRGDFEEGTRILAIHTGGLQGIKGMNERLKHKNLKINYEA